MFAKISYTWQLMGASWDVLKRTKSLILFPLLSGICCILVFLSFLIPIIATKSYQMDDMPRDTQHKILYYTILFLFYFCNYFVIAFFNTAIIAGAVSRMAGGEPTVGGCISEATKRIHLIAGWALVSATVGLVLRIIEERSKKAGQFIAGLIGMAFSVVSFLVIPILVVENKGPIAALTESTKLLKRTWGEQLVGNFSFGTIFFFLSLPAFAVIAAGIYLGGAAHSIMLAGLCMVVAVVYLVALALIQSALQSIFQAAVYMHTQGVSPEGFSTQLLRGAMDSE